MGHKWDDYRCVQCTKAAHYKRTLEIAKDQRQGGTEME